MPSTQTADVYLSVGQYVLQGLDASRGDVVAAAVPLSVPADADDTPRREDVERARLAGGAAGAALWRLLEAARLANALQRQLPRFAQSFPDSVNRRVAGLSVALLLAGPRADAPECAWSPLCLLGLGTRARWPRARCRAPRVARAVDPCAVWFEQWIMVRSGCCRNRARRVAHARALQLPQLRAFVYSFLGMFAPARWGACARPRGWCAGDRPMRLLLARSEAFAQRLSAQLSARNGARVEHSEPLAFEVAE